MNTTTSSVVPESSVSPQAFMHWMHDLSDIVILAAQAPVQSQYPLAILRARIFPSLWHGQYLVLRKEGVAIAFVNWAWLSDDFAPRYQQTQCYIEPEQWRGGSNLWFMEILGGQEHIQALIHELRKIIPPNTQAHWHEVHEIGGASAVVRTAWFGPQVNA